MEKMSEMRMFLKAPIIHLPGLGRLNPIAPTVGKCAATHFLQNPKLPRVMNENFAIWWSMLSLSMASFVVPAWRRFLRMMIRIASHIHWAAYHPSQLQVLGHGLW